MADFNWGGLGTSLRAFGTGVQGGDVSAVLQGRKQEIEREERKGNIAALMSNMGIGGNQRALLDMLPQEAQLMELQNYYNNQPQMEQQMPLNYPEPSVVDMSSMGSAPDRISQMLEDPALNEGQRAYLQMMAPQPTQQPTITPPMEPIMDRALGDLSAIPREQLLGGAGEIEPQASVFGDPKGETKVAGGSWAENIAASPLTGAMKTDAMRTASAYGALMSELNDYDDIYKKGGQAVLPGGQKDMLTTSRRAIQLQLKELFNLGVLNGPDLALMDSMLIDPTGVSNAVMDFFGIEFDDRFSNNIGQVRGILDNIMKAKMEAAGIAPPDSKPSKADGVSTSDPLGLLK